MGGGERERGREGRWREGVRAGGRKGVGMRVGVGVGVGERGESDLEALLLFQLLDLVDKLGMGREEWATG